MNNSESFNLNATLYKVLENIKKKKIIKTLKANAKWDNLGFIK